MPFSQLHLFPPLLLQAHEVSSAAGGQRQGGMSRCCASQRCRGAETAGDMSPGTGEWAQRRTVSLLGNLLHLPQTHQNLEGIGKSGNRIKKTYLKRYPTIMQQRQNVSVPQPS